MLLRKPTFYLAVLGILAAGLLVRRSSQRPPAPPPESPPARSPWEGTVAATGLIEAARENVRIAAPRQGLVLKVHVAVGDPVRQGDPLIQIDDREARAREASLSAQLAAAESDVAVRAAEVADWEDQQARFSRLERDQAASVDELRRREFGLSAARARLAASRAAAAAAAAQWRQAGTELEVLTVRAPRDGRILQVNIRAGEFAPAAVQQDPLILLGDVDTLQVRAEVDEQNALLVTPGAPAVASPKGYADLRLPLRFVRVEPYVVPKRNLTGDSLERVDTRVLQVIYAFDRPDFPLYVGQQVDVFIQRPPSASAE